MAELPGDEYLFNHMLVNFHFFKSQGESQVQSKQAKCNGNAGK